MDTKKIEKHVKLLSFLYYHPNCEIMTAINELGLKKDATYKTIGKWIKEGKVVKIRRKVMLLGGAKDEHSLTPQGIALFNRLKDALNNKLKDNT